FSMSSLIRTASPLLWPWLASGSVPPEDSIRISDHTMPVLICTEATLLMLMDISSRLNQERLCRVTDLSLTSMYVGNKVLPLVQRLARKISDGINQVPANSIPSPNGELSQ